MSNIVETVDFLLFLFGVLTLVCKCGTLFAVWGLILAGTKLIHAVRDYICALTDKV